MKAVNLLFLLIILGLTSCGEDNPYDSAVGYDQAMKDYMAAQGWQGIPTADGMYYVIDEPGGSNKPVKDADVTVNYRGYYTDNVEFDSNDNISFKLWQVIEGWTIGIPKFGTGGKGHLLIPPHLAYSEVNSQVRDKSILIFDIELLDFTMDKQTGVLFKNAGEEGKGGLDLDNGETTAPNNLESEIIDQGNDANNEWSQKIAPVADAIMYQLIPGENGLAEDFSTSSIKSINELVNLSTAGLPINVSETLEVGDMFVVNRSDKMYSILVDEINVMTDTTDNYLLTIKQ